MKNTKPRLMVEIEDGAIQNIISTLDIEINIVDRDWEEKNQWRPYPRMKSYRIRRMTSM